MQTKYTLHVFTPDLLPRECIWVDPVNDEAVVPGFSCKVAEFFEQA